MALIFGIGSVVHQNLGEKMLLLFSDPRFKGDMDMARPFAPLHSHAIDNNSGQPGGKLGFASELAQMLESGQQRILYRVLGIRFISQESIGATIEIW
jgi:sorbitol-specific phosphotransferase system component IIA